MKKISIKKVPKLLQQENYYLIDIRSPYLYEQGHFPNSYNIPVNSLINVALKYLNKNYHYLIICEYGNESKKIVKLLNSLNFNAYHVKGGIHKYKGPLALSN
ncbi:MAG TPA: rhodanese-like domain-containing protein [Bacilli bacterium]|nr:rhodanese-like domain-containing protein [Bacilli bacterium]HQA19234.1 rhodanese-like domain-containing protein [Bacilli bacterium]HQD91660.1 rhodanese-like domain-containing protein [Bacilli bacterium]